MILWNLRIKFVASPAVGEILICSTVARKGYDLYKLYFHRTNFIFILQTLL